MTIKRAIEILRRMQEPEMWEPIITPEAFEALQMACTALKDSEKPNSSESPGIVRCRDCKHRYLEGMIWHCPFGLMGGENFFCGYGSLGTAERRTDDANVIT